MSVEAEEVFYIGPGEETQKILLDDINILPQTRKTPITEESVEELVNSILNRDEDGVPHLTLLHHPLVNMIAGQRRAKTYLSDLNDFQNTEYRFSDFRKGSNGLYNANVAGERRIFSSGVAMRQAGIPRHLMGIEVTPRYDMEFGEAILYQIGENTHSQLSPVEEAKAIQYAFLHGMSNGMFKTKADIVRRLPYSEKKIRAAMAYCELPNEIKDMVEGVAKEEVEKRALARGMSKEAVERLDIKDRHPSISYGLAVALSPLQKVLERKYLRQGQSPDEAHNTVTVALMAETTHILNRRWGLEKANEYIQGLKNSLLLSFSMDSLFELEDGREAVVGRADRAYAELTRDILDRSLGHLVGGMSVIKLETLSPEQRAALLSQLDQLDVVRQQLQLGAVALQPSGDAQLFDLPSRKAETLDGLSA